MSETYNCDKCNKSYKTKNSLKLHIIRSKNHNKESIEEEEYICEYCKKLFDFPSVLKRHVEVCPNKYIVLYNNIKDEFESFKQRSNDEYNSLKEKSFKDFKDLKIKYEEISIENKELKTNNHIYRQRLDEHTSKYDNLCRENYNTEKTLKELQTNFLLIENSCKHYKEFYDKHTQVPAVSQCTNNITIDQRSVNTHIQSDVINIVKNFIPLTPQFIHEQMKDISAKKLAHIGVKYIGTHAINSKIGENVVVTDASRKVCSYMDEKNQIIKDPNCTNLTQLILDETSKSENIKLAIEIAKQVGTSELTDPKYQSKMLKNCIDIQKVDKKEPESSINNDITSQIAKQASTKKTIKKKEQKRIQKQIDKLKIKESPPFIDTTPLKN